jgi:hypothetical protein
MAASIKLLSALTFKPFFSFLYENISDEQRGEYVDFLLTNPHGNHSGNDLKTKKKLELEDEDEEDDEASDEFKENYASKEERMVFFSKLNVLKTIISVRKYYLIFWAWQLPAHQQLYETGGYHLLQPHLLQYQRHPLQPRFQVFLHPPQH